MEILRPFRERIGKIDEQLASLVAERLRVCVEVAHVKQRNGIPMMQPDRVKLVCDSYARRGNELGVSPQFMRSLAMLLIDEACRVEDIVLAPSSGVGEP